MRWLFLIPELDTGWVRPYRQNLAVRLFYKNGLTNWLARRGNFYTRSILRVPTTFGGTINIMRHAAVARSLGADAYLCSMSGKDTYGDYAVVDLPYVKWSDRRSDDVVLLPEFACHLVSEVEGRSIVYLQAPNLRNDFDYRSPNVALWTDSPFMLEESLRYFPDKEIPIVPNVVDPVAFPFRSQAERTDGLIFAFPRKNPEFIEETRSRYEKSGGTFWKFELIDGLPLAQLARRMQEAQAFLASAVVEGCALPPQESMACGMVVVGRSAQGANFSMQDRETAMIAETPTEAAEALRELEDPELRDRLSRRGHEFISRYFPDAEPLDFWRGVLERYGDPSVAAAVSRRQG